MCLTKVADPNINFEVNYGGSGDNIQAYGKTHWDIDKEDPGEVTVGASFIQDLTKLDKYTILQVYN